MIKVEVTKCQDDILKIHLTGHANSDVIGKDLVCAEVSAIVTGTLNALDELANDDCELSMTEIKVKKITHDSQLILKSMVIQLKTVENVNSEFIKIRTLEVKE